MNDLLVKDCELFLENTKALKDNFKWAYGIFPLSSVIYSSKNLEVDVNKINDCCKLTKSLSSIGSNFRGTSNLAFSTMLSLEKNPEEKLNETFKVLELIKKDFIFSYSSYLPIAALLIAKMVEESQYETIIKKSKELYDDMRKEHPFITYHEDYIFAILLSIKDTSVEGTNDKIEKCYKLLKHKLMGFNHVQALSHVMVVDDNFEVKCRRVIEIYEKLKDKHFNYGNGMQLVTLGVLALVDEDIDTIVSEISDVYECIKSSKGFGSLSLSEDDRLMYAGILVSNYYINKLIGTNEKLSTLSSNIITMIVAQQVVLYGTISAVESTDDDSMSLDS